MGWIDSIENSLRYIEANLTEDIVIDDVARHAYSSVSHFQRIFNILTGYTVGEYIRNRRLSLAGRDLLNGGDRVIDIAMKYRYDTPEGFSKAFARFHGIAPSETKLHGDKLKYFNPLTIKIIITGGFDMVKDFTDKFYWNEFIGDGGSLEGGEMSADEKYQALINWAAEARGRNPVVFDDLTEWVLDDSEWNEAALEENRRILMDGVLRRFREQNAQLRKQLDRLAASVNVNKAIYAALDRFDDALSGKINDKVIADAVAGVFGDFTLMRERRVRELFAGNKTGPTGTDSVELFGYINILKECDAGVQWTLFMPDFVYRQQKGFHVESFEYKKMPAMRFIGCEGEEYAEPGARKKLFGALDALAQYSVGFDYDVLFTHFFGRGVDVESWHGYWGRFFAAGTPVPEGLDFIDFIEDNDGGVGAPYISMFAYAVFDGDIEAMHSEEGYDGDAMYDITRNIMLGQGVGIPYPTKYWTAEVFPDGNENRSRAYMFSAEL